MEDTCPFCQIARGELTVHEVFRSDSLIAFLDRAPIRPGHVQVVPIEHYDYFEALPQNLSIEIMLLAQVIAKCQKSVFGVERVAFLFTGWDIPHAHCHLVPMKEKTDITSRRYILEPEVTFKSLPHASDAEQSQIAVKLSNELRMNGN